MSEADAARTVTAHRVSPGVRPAEDFTYSVVVIGAAPKARAKSPEGQGDRERRADGRSRTRLRDATVAEGRGAC